MLEGVAASTPHPAVAAVAAVESRVPAGVAATMTMREEAAAAVAVAAMTVADAVAAVAVAADGGGWRRW